MSLSHRQTKTPVQTLDLGPDEGEAQPEISELMGNAFAGTQLGELGDEDPSLLDLASGGAETFATPGGGAPDGGSPAGDESGASPADGPAPVTAAGSPTAETATDDASAPTAPESDGLTCAPPPSAPTAAAPPSPPPSPASTEPAPPTVSAPPALEAPATAAHPVVEQVRAQVEGPAPEGPSLSVLQGELQALCATATTEATAAAKALAPETQTAITTAQQAITQARGQVPTLFAGPRAQITTAIGGPIVELQKGLETATTAIDTAKAEALSQAVPTIAGAATALEAEKTAAVGKLAAVLQQGRSALGPLQSRLEGAAATKTDSVAKSIEAKATAETDPKKSQALSTKAQAARTLGQDAKGRIQAAVKAATTHLDQLEPTLAERVAQKLDPRIATARAKATSAKQTVTSEAKRLSATATATHDTTKQGLENARKAAEDDLDAKEKTAGDGLTTLSTTVADDLEAARTRAADAMTAAATGLDTTLTAKLTQLQQALATGPALPAAERTTLLDTLRGAMRAGEQALTTELETAATGLSKALADRQRTFTTELSTAVTDAGTEAEKVSSTLATAVRTQTDTALRKLNGAGKAFKEALTGQLGPLEQAASAELTAGEADVKGLETALSTELSGAQRTLETELNGLVAGIDDKAATQKALPAVAAIFAVSPEVGPGAAPLAQATVDAGALEARARVLLTEGLTSDAAMDAVAGLDDATAEALSGVMESLTGTSTADLIAATVVPEERSQAVAMAMGDPLASALALVVGIAARGTFDATTDPTAIEAAVTQLSAEDFRSFCEQVSGDPKLDKVMRVNQALRAAPSTPEDAGPAPVSAPDVTATKGFWAADTAQAKLQGERSAGAGIGAQGQVATPDAYRAVGPLHSKLDADGKVVQDGERRGGHPLRVAPRTEPSGTDGTDPKELRRQVKAAATAQEAAAAQSLTDNSFKKGELDSEDPALAGTAKRMGRRAAVADKVGFSRYGFTLGDKNSVTVGKDLAASYTRKIGKNSSANVRYDGDTLSGRADTTLGGVLKLRYGMGKTDKVDDAVAEHGDAHDTRYRVRSETGENSDSGVGVSGMPVGVGGGSSSSSSVKTERVFASKKEADRHKERMEDDPLYRKKVERAHENPLDEEAFPAGAKVTLSQVKGESATGSAGALGVEHSKTSARSIEVEKLPDGKLKVVLSQSMLEAKGTGPTMKMGSVGKQGSTQKTRIRQYEIDPKDPAALAGYYALLASGEPNELPHPEKPKRDTLALPELGLKPTLEGEVTAHRSGYDGGILGAFDSGDGSTVVDGRFTDAQGRTTRVQSGKREFDAGAGVLGLDLGSHAESHTLSTNTAADGSRSHVLSSTLKADDDGALDAASRRQSGLQGDGLEHQVDGTSEDKGGELTIEREVSEQMLLDFASKRTGGPKAGFFEGMGTRAHAKEHLRQALASARTKEDKLAAVRGYVAAVGQHAISEIEQDTGHRSTNHVTSSTDLDLFGPAQQRKLDATVARWRAQLMNGADAQKLLPAIRRFKAKQYGLLRRLKQGKPGVPQELLAEHIERARQTLEGIDQVEQLAVSKRIDLGTEDKADEELATPAASDDKSVEQRATDAAIAEVFATRKQARAARTAYRKEHFMHTRAGHTSARNQLTGLRHVYERHEDNDREQRKHWARLGTLTDSALAVAAEGHHKRARGIAQHLTKGYRRIAAIYRGAEERLAALRRLLSTGTRYFDNEKRLVFREDERDQ